jgi:Histidine kinase-, DNA gyrase B-, and HSP90-like ATPase
MSRFLRRKLLTAEETSVAFEPFFGGFIIETLTIGMYGEARNAIREYIQNGFDSVQRAIEDVHTLQRGEGLIEVEMAADRKSLVIRDNGAGLSVKTAATVLTRVGASNKNHRRNAGFRGIGRLAGIVFSNTVTFTTKAKGEREQTTVVFDGKKMREAMAPGKGSSKSALELLRDTVTAHRSGHPEVNKQFFEVSLEGFVDEPDECKSPKELDDFLSQVAPVPYPDDFPYRARLKEAADVHGIPIEEVRVTIKDGAKDPVPVTKQYRVQYDFDSGRVALSDCEIHVSPTNRWWAWVGKKDESGAYTDEKVGGLRVRVRNIQIDGTEVVRNIFREHAKSHARFQDYFLGEIFVAPASLVPNARRDGFEEDGAWKSVRSEIASVVKLLVKETHIISKKGQLSVDALQGNLSALEEEMRLLRKAEFADADRVISLSKNVTTYQARVAKGLQGAPMETAAELQAIGSAMTDIKREALSHVSVAAATVDREQVQQEARDEFLKEILAVLEEALPPNCFAAAQDALLEEFGEG